MPSPSARPGLSPVLVAAVSIVALGLGAVGGALFEKNRRVSAKESASESGGAGGGSASQKSPGDVSSDSAASSSTGAAAGGDTSKKLAEAQAEVARLSQRVAELEKLVPRAKSKEDKIAIAKELMECLRKGKRDGEAFRRMLQLVGELDPDMGPFFLERYGDPEEKADKSMMLEFMMAAGGPEVAEWLQAQLTVTGADEEPRRRLLRILGGGSKELFSIKNLPVKGPLANLAFQYSSSEISNERQAAAGLFGGIESLESRTSLYRMASSDSDFGVKETAIRSLAFVGDKETITWLETYRVSASGTNEWETKRLQDAVDTTREKLQKKFPQ